jgi:hypothetical protein
MASQTQGLLQQKAALENSINATKDSILNDGNTRTAMRVSAAKTEYANSANISEEHKTAVLAHSDKSMS